MEVVGVSRPRTGGTVITKNGRKVYRGKRKHWYVYFYDDEGRFSKKMISAVQVPYYGSLIRRRKSYVCGSCGNRFRSIERKCPSCGSKVVKLAREARSALKTAS